MRATAATRFGKCPLEFDITAFYGAAIKPYIQKLGDLARQRFSGRHIQINVPIIKTVNYEAIRFDANILVPIVRSPGKAQIVRVST